MYRIHVMISGDVQGVFFRISSQDKANELNLTDVDLLDNNKIIIGQLRSAAFSPNLKKSLA